MWYEPQRRRRRAMRRQGHDYAQPGAYFVTRCTHERAESFGSVTDGVLMMNPGGASGGKKGFKPAVLRPKVRWEGMDMAERTLAAIRRASAAHRGDAPLAAWIRRYLRGGPTSRGGMP